MANTIIGVLRFADTRYAALSKERMKAYFGHRMELLPIPSTLTIRDLLPVVLRPGSRTVRAQLAPPNYMVIERIATVSQDDPMWGQARIVPGLMTASTMADFCCLRTAAVAGVLHVPDFMVWDTGVNPTWDDYVVRLHYTTLPRAPLDALMGAVYTTHGKEHENNANAQFFYHHPKFRYKDQGLTYVTPETLKAAGLRNLLTGELITELEFLLAASPDGVGINMETLEEFLVEWKAAKNVKQHYTSKIEKDRGKREYPGIEFDPNPDAGPYEKIKSYYVPQAMLQMLACLIRKRPDPYAYWGCWTLLKGMRVWMIRYSKEYVELMLTVLIFLYREFALKADSVPNDYFEEHRETPIGKIHARLVALTADIIDMKRPDIAYEYAFYSGEDTEKVAAEVLFEEVNAAPGYVGRQLKIANWTFPNVPPEVPSYAVIGLCVDALGGNCIWLQKPVLIKERIKNLLTLLDKNHQLHFLGPFIDRILKGCPESHPGLEECATHPNVQMSRLEKAEKFVSIAALLLCRIRDGIGGMAMEVELMNRPMEIRDLVKLSNRVRDRVDRVHGLYPCSDVFRAIQPAPGERIDYFEFEFARLYYNRLLGNTMDVKVETVKQEPVDPVEPESKKRPYVVHTTETARDGIKTETVEQFAPVSEESVKKVKIEAESTDWDVEIEYMDEDPSTCKAGKWKYEEDDKTLDQVFERIKENMKGRNGITKILIEWSG